MYLGLGYCCGWYLNHVTSRGCSTVAPSNPANPNGTLYPASVITNLNNAFLASSFANFTGASIVSNTATAVTSGVADPTNPGHNTLYVQAKTQVKVNPFFTLPSVPLINSLQIDGLTRPVVFTYFDSVPAQETGVN